MLDERDVIDFGIEFPQKDRDPAAKMPELGPLVSGFSYGPLLRSPAGFWWGLFYSPLFCRWYIAGMYGCPD